MKLNDQYQLFRLNVKESFARKMLQTVIQQEIFHKWPNRKIKLYTYILGHEKIIILFLVFDQENNNVDQNFHQ